MQLIVVELIAVLLTVQFELSTQQPYTVWFGYSSGAIESYTLTTTSLTPGTTMSSHTNAASYLLQINQNTLASASADYTVKVWDSDTDTLLNTYYGHSLFAQALALLPGGFLVSGARDRALRVWNLANNLVTLIPCTSDVNDMKVNTVSTANGILVVAMTVGAAFYDATTYELLDANFTSVTYMCIAILQPFGYVLLGGDSLDIYNATSGESLFSQAYSPQIYSVLQLADQVTVVFGLANGNIVLFNGISFSFGATITCAHTTYIGNIFYTPDEMYFVSEARDQTVIMWEWTYMMNITHVNTFTVSNSPRYGLVIASPYTGTFTAPTVTPITQVNYTLSLSSDPVLGPYTTSVTIQPGEVVEIKINQLTAGPEGTVNISLGDGTWSSYSIASSYAVISKKYTAVGNYTVVANAAVVPQTYGAITSSVNSMQIIVLPATAYPIWLGYDSGIIAVYDLSTTSITTGLNLISHSLDTIGLLQINQNNVASASCDCTLKIWELSTGGLINTYYHLPATGHVGYMQALCMLPGGYLAVGGRDPWIRIYDLTTNFVTFVPCANDVYAMIVNPAVGVNGILAVAMYTGVAYYDAVTYALLWSNMNNVYYNCIDVLRPSGNIIVAGQSLDIYNTTGGLLFNYTYPVMIETIKLMYDNVTVVFGLANGSVCLFDSVGLTFSATLNPHTSDVMTMFFTPDFALLVTGSRDHTLIMWQLIDIMNITEVSSFTNSGTQRYGISIQSTYTGVYTAPTVLPITNVNFTISLSSDPVLGPYTSSVIVSPSESIALTLNQLTAGPNSSVLVTFGDGNSSTYFLASSSVNITKSYETSGNYTINIAAVLNGLNVTVSVNSMLIIVVPPPTYQIWLAYDSSSIAQYGVSSLSLDTGPSMTSHTANVLCLLQINQYQVVSASIDNTIKAWDIATNTLINTYHGHTTYVQALCVLPSGYLASAGGDSTIIVWDMHNNLVVERVPVVAANIFVMMVNTVASSNGVLVLATDSGARFYDAVTFEVIAANVTAMVYYCIDILRPSGDVIMGGNNLDIYNSTGGLLFSYTSAWQLWTIKLLNDNVTVVYGLGNGQVGLFNSIDYTFGPTLTAHTQHVETMFYTQDLAYLVTGSTDWSLIIWESSGVMSLTLVNIYTTSGSQRDGIAIMANETSIYSMATVTLLTNINFTISLNTDPILGPYTTTVIYAPNEPFTIILNQLTAGPQSTVNVTFGDGTWSVYNLASSSVNITKSYASIGNYSIVAYPVLIGLNATVSVNSMFVMIVYVPPPLLSVDKSGTLANPVPLLKSNTIVLQATVVILCPYSYSISKFWTLEQVDPVSGAPIGGFIDMTSNSSAFAGFNATLLVIYPLVLDYGTYELTLNVSFTYSDDNGVTFITKSSNLTTFIVISPAGINVFGFQNGILQQDYGLNQPVVVDPGTFSADLDGLSDTSSLNFTFFCQIVPNGQDPTIFFSNSRTISQIAINVFQVNDPVNGKCFTNSSEITTTMSRLSIVGGALRYIAGFQYQFFIQAGYRSINYTQVLTVNLIATSPQLPLVTLACRFNCIKFSSYQVLNPTSDIIIDASCTSGCPAGQAIYYQFEVYEATGAGTNFAWTLFTNSAYFLGAPTSLTMLQKLFIDYSNVTSWMVSFTAEVQNVTGLSSIVFLINQPPIGGFCSVSPTTGVALSTFFSVNCSNWTDADSKIASYVLIAQYVGNPVNLTVSSNSNGLFSNQLPNGVANLFVQVLDSFGGVTTFPIPQTITISMSNAVVANVVTSLLTMNGSSSLVSVIQSGTLAQTTQLVATLGAALNTISSSGGNSSISLDDQVATRSLLISAVSAMPVSDMASVQLISSSLSTVTAVGGDVSLSSAAQVLNKLSSMLPVLQGLTQQQATVADIAQVYSDMANTMNNILSGVSNSVYTNNYLANSSSSSMSAQSAYVNSCISMINQTAALQNQLDSLIASYTSPSNSISINLGTTQITFTNNMLNLFNSSTAIGTLNAASISLSGASPYCQLYEQSLDISNVNCSSIPLIQKTAVTSQAVVGANGFTSDIGSSQTVSLSFFYNINQKLNVNSLSPPITITIPRATDANITAFELITLSSVATIQCPNTDLFLQYAVTINQSNAISIQLKQAVAGLGYLILMKFGSTPQLNSTYSSYDQWQLYCPNDTITQGPDTFHLFFVSEATINGYAGLVGYAIRELTNSEINSYCSSQGTSLNSISSPPVLPQRVDHSSSNYSSSSICKMITTDFELRVFLSGCYYLDTSTGMYTSEGTEVSNETSISATVCLVSHCTDFAGGFVVVPNTINFDTVWANASVASNPIIYATVFTIIGLYLALAVLCRIFDMRDMRKKGVTMLNDSQMTNLYEVVVFTGSRKHASTESTVFIMMSGERGESKVIKLHDKKRKLFRRGGVDTFIIATPKYLGKIFCVRIWHDNKGEGAAKASWYLKHVIVSDLTTMSKSFFICEQWLAVEKEDGLIGRILPCAGDKEKKDLKYLIKKETQNKFSDGHLWFSLVARPVTSTFTRLDRLTCVFVLMCISMLANILWYGTDNSTDPNALNLGPFTLTPEQIGIGIMSNLIVFPPSFLLLQLFRRSRDRKDAFANQEAKKQKGLKKLKTFPWWMKIVAYILSFACAGISIFFILLEGITFGNAKVQKWLTSLLFSMLTSIFLTQPIQMALTTLFLVTVFRKSTEFSKDTAEAKPFEEPDDEVVDQEFKTKLENFRNSYAALPAMPEFLKQVRMERLKAKMLKDVIKKAIIQSMFLWILYVTAFSNRDLNSFKYQNSLQQLMTRETDKIHNVEDFWAWTRDTFADRLKYSTNKNGMFMLIDQQSFLIEVPMLRQIRVQNNSCQVSGQMSGSVQYCTADYNSFNGEDKSFDFDWMPNPSMSNVSNAEAAFTYTHAASVSSYPLTGEYNTYLGGGYVYKMNGSASDMISNFSLLQQTNWIDRQTRAVFIEFSIFNPNINMFAYCYLLFEIMPTGSLVISSRFYPMTLFDSSSDIFSFGTVCAMIYIGMIFVLSLRQLYLINLKKKQYFKELWSYLDISLIAFSFTAFAIWLYRVWEGQSLKSNLSSRPLGKYINMQMFAYWDDTLCCMLAFCACLGSLKFFKILQFNHTIRILIKTMQLAFSEMISFVFISVLVVFAFIQSGYLIFNDQIYGLSTFMKSVETGFLLILGKFQLQEMLTANPVFAVIFYIFFNGSVIMILVHLFISLITDAFEQAKEDDKNGDPLHLEDFLYEKIKEKFGNLKSVTLNRRSNKVNFDEAMKRRLSRRCYLEYAKEFDYKTSILMEYVNESTRVKDVRDKHLKALNKKFSNQRRL